MSDEKNLPPQECDKDVQAKIARRTRRSLLVGGATMAAAAVGYRLLDRSPSVGMLRRPLRAAEDLNAALAEHVVGERSLAPTYPANRALKNPRPNGPFGIRKDLDPASWRLKVAGLASPERHAQYAEDISAWEYRYEALFVEKAEQLDGDIPQSAGAMTGDNNKLPASMAPVSLDMLKNAAASLDASPVAGLLFTMDDIRKLPFVEQTTEFKCVEGWSEIISFGGVRFRDFLAAYPPFRNPDGSLPKYAAMSTPDHTYFSGFEMASLLHPQTLLCFEMSGRELTPAHGAPLRLAMPLKYGYKQIKQIGHITYTNTKPEDYWASLGFDWHGGL